MPMNEEMMTVDNPSLPFPLKHVGTCTKNIENRDTNAIRNCISIPMANRTTNKWRVSGIRTMETDEQGEHTYVAVFLQNDRLLAMGMDMGEVAVENLPLFRYAN